MYKVVTIIAKIISFFRGILNPWEESTCNKSTIERKGFFFSNLFEQWKAEGPSKASIVMVIHLFTLLDHDP